MYLDELKTGELARILDVGEQIHCVKLLEMGCLPGETIRVKLVAPFNDPIAVEVGGNLISMCRAEARGITVAPMAAPVTL